MIYNLSQSILLILIGFNLGMATCNYINDRKHLAKDNLYVALITSLLLGLNIVTGYLLK